MDKSKQFYNTRLGAPTDRLDFKVLNLYQVEQLGDTFDEIIC